MTARLGARKWGPRFAAALDQLAFPAADGTAPLDPAPLAAFADHPVHGVRARLAPLRPPSTSPSDPPPRAPPARLAPRPPGS